MINYQTITIDLQPDYREPVVQMYLSERDVGRPIQVNVLMQGQPYSFTAGTTVHIDLRKPSGHVVQVNGNYAVGSNVVLFNVVEQMAAEPGMCLTELSIVGDGQDPIGSKNWLTKVELSPMHAGDPSETWIEDLDELVQEAMEGHIDATLSIEGDAADAKATGDAIAAAVEQIPAVDDTLTVSGAAADAAVTGTELADLKSAIKDQGKYISEQVYYNENAYDGVCSNTVYLTSDGTASNTNLRYVSATNLIPIQETDIVQFVSYPAVTNHRYILYYASDQSYIGYEDLVSITSPLTIPIGAAFFRFEFTFPNDTPANTVNRWVVYKNQTETTKQRIEAMSAEIQFQADALNGIVENGNEYTQLTKVSTKSSYKAVVSNGTLTLVSASAFSVNVFEMKKGRKYKVYGFGYDVTEFYIACTGQKNVIADSLASTVGYENILCGTSVYPSGYTYHTVIFTAEHDGFFYVNYKATDSESAVYIANKVAKLPDSVSDLYKDHGVYISNGNYYHFKRDGASYIIRKFNRRGPNNLFQWTGLYIGTVNDASVSIVSTIAEYATDIVGPICIFNTVIWPGIGGKWSGGNHSVAVEGVQYATAEQDSFSCLVNGDVVNQDGLYYGVVEIRTKNKLYFPQSITGADLTQARLALNEYRFYRLSDQMDVRVRLQFVEDARILTYYGMQGVTSGFTDFFLANNETYGVFSEITENTTYAEKEHKIYMTGNGLHFDMELKSIGLGEYTHNSGQDETIKYFYIPQQVGSGANPKVYFVCMRNDNNIQSGLNCVWEGKYSIYN